MERVFADAKEKHAMHYTQHRGPARVTNRVRLKYAAMNLKKLANWSWSNSVFLCFSAFLPQYTQQPLLSPLENCGSLTVCKDGQQPLSRLLPVFCCVCMQRKRQPRTAGPLTPPGKWRSSAPGSRSRPSAWGSCKRSPRRPAAPDRNCASPRSGCGHTAKSASRRGRDSSPRPW